MPPLKRSPARQEEGAEFVESLDRGLRVLQALGADRRAMTLSNLARSVELPRATVRRILMTLVRSGFVTGDDRLFALTPRVLRFASAYLASNPITTVMQPLLDEVAAQARETCSLAILDGDEVVFVARACPARIFTAGPEIGYRLPAFCTSVGRALLGGLTNDDLTARVAAMTLTAQTASTLLDKPTLIATMIADRSRGYSLVDHEAEDGFRSISVPVQRYDGAVVAAANIGAHVDRITTGDMIDRFLPLLQAMARAAKPLLL